MKNVDSQVILYAKGWFKKTDVIEDLRKIYAKRNGMYLEHVSDNDVYSLLTSLVFNLCIKSKEDDYPFTCLMEDIFRSRNSFGTSYVTNKKYAIESMLSMIRMTEVVNEGNILIELDEPDYTILPKKEDL